MLDLIHLSDSSRVRDGMADMLTAAIGEHGYTLTWVEPAIALLVIECAKRAEDRDEWFPHGKWATIQAIQAKVDAQLNTLFTIDGVPSGEVKHG